MWWFYFMIWTSRISKRHHPWQRTPKLFVFFFHSFLAHNDVVKHFFTINENAFWYMYIVNSAHTRTIFLAYLGENCWSCLEYVLLFSFDFGPDVRHSLERYVLECNLGEGKLRTADVCMYGWWPPPTGCDDGCGRCILCGVL